MSLSLRNPTRKFSITGLAPSRYAVINIKKKKIICSKKRIVINKYSRYTNFDKKKKLKKKAKKKKEKNNHRTVSLVALTIGTKSSIHAK